MPGPDAAVDLKLDGLPSANGTATLTQYLIDADHSNSYETWKRMGSPIDRRRNNTRNLKKRVSSPNPANRKKSRSKMERPLCS